MTGSATWCLLWIHLETLYITSPWGVRTRKPVGRWDVPDTKSHCGRLPLWGGDTLLSRIVRNAVNVCECANGAHPFYRRGHIQLPYYKHFSRPWLENSFFFLQDCKLQCGSYFSLPGHACGSPVALGFLGHDGFLHANLIHIYCVKFYLHGCPAQKTEAQSLLAAMPLLGALARVHARVLQFLPTLLSKSFGLSSFSSKAGIDLRCFFCEGHDLGVQIFVYCLVFVRKWGKQFLCIMPDKWRSLKRVAIAFS